MTWCWQVTNSIKHELYSRGYLFFALYRLNWLGYRRNGLYITSNEVNNLREIEEPFLVLLLDVQWGVANRIWNERNKYNEVILRDNHPVIPISLNFLFCIIWTIENQDLVYENPIGNKTMDTRGVHSLLYFAYTCVWDLFIGGLFYLAKKDYKVWYFSK